MNVKPCREHNAIQAVAFIFDFSRYFTPGEIATLQKLNNGSFPRVQEHKSVSVQFNPGQPIHQKEGTVSGVTFDMTNDAGQPIWAVTFQENQAVIRCHDYTRWADIFDKTCNYINQFFDDLTSDSNKIIGIGLEYFDEFFILNFQSPWMQELFKENSIHLPAYLFDLKDVWHLHSGYLTEDKEKLNRFNIDCINLKGDSYSLRMHTQHHTRLSNQIGDEFSEFKEKHMIEIIESMHTCNKYILKDVLSEETLSMINLETVG